MEPFRCQCVKLGQVLRGYGSNPPPQAVVTAMGGHFLVLDGAGAGPARLAWPRSSYAGLVVEPIQPVKTLLARTLDQWRGWLAEHHASESEVWLIFHKQHTGIASIDFKDALDEALCFGWVDSLVKRLDDRRYARKFTPRRPDSPWSAVNRKRYAELEAAGRLQPPGIERPPTDRGYGPRPERLALPAQLPAYIQAALRANPAASRHFEALAAEQRRRYFAWIESAKRQQTKLRRLEEAIRLLASGKVLGLK